MGIAITEHVSGILDDDVLEASTSAEARHVIFSCIPDRTQRFVHVLIWTAGRHPDSCVFLQGFDSDILGRKPVRANLETESLIGMQYCRIGRQMRRKLRVEFAQDRDL